MTFPNTRITDDEHKAMMLFDIETYPDRIVFTGPDGETRTMMFTDALVLFKEGDST